MSTITAYLQNLFVRFTLTSLRFTDILEILILAFVIYKIIVWIKDTKAWMLLRGIIFILLFILLAAILRLDTILWLAQKLASIVAVAAIVVFQPEIRRALEKLGEKGKFSTIFGSSTRYEETSMTKETIDNIVCACEEMSNAKTGALIVVERQTQLSEYEETGIPMDSLISRQLILNIFEHNTPLHDGAIIIRGNRIVSATCYFPLTPNKDLEKKFGTRHRAALGLSELTDAFVIVVSEETGAISYAFGDKLVSGISLKELKIKLTDMQNWGERHYQSSLPDVPMSDVQMTDVRVSDVPKTDDQRSDEPVPDVPKSDEPVSETPVSDVKKSGVPVPEAPKSDDPVSETPVSDVKKSDVSVSDIPMSDGKESNEEENQA